MVPISSFLQVAIDSHVIAHGWYGANFKDPTLITMAKALAPAYLRLGYHIDG